MPLSDLRVVSSVTVYFVFATSAALGVRVTVFRSGAHVTVAGTMVPAGSFSVTLDVVNNAACIPRSNFAVTLVARSTPVALLAGVIATTFGGSGVSSIADSSGWPTFAIVEIVIVAAKPSGPGVAWTLLIV